MRVSEERLRVLMANNEASHLETRKCIKSALLNLMQSDPYEAISMTDIIRRSGVSRSGVYKNYKSKDEIMRDIYREPIEDIDSKISNSVFDNVEIIFRTGKKHETAIKVILEAGLEYNYLNLLNERIEDASSFYFTRLWIGMIFNSFFEWARSGMDEPVEMAVERVKAGLKMVSASIETGQVVSTELTRS